MQNLKQTLLRFFWPRKIKYQLIAGVALVHAVLMSVFVFDLVAKDKALLNKNIQNQALTLASAVATNAEPWVLSNNVNGLNEIIAAQLNYPNLNYVYITNTEGKVLAHSQTEFIGQYLTDANSIKVLKEGKQQLDFDSVNQQWLVTEPIKIDNRLIGWARTSLSTEQLAKNQQAIVWQGLLYAFIAIALGSVIAWLLGSSLTRRIRNVIAATNRVNPEKQSKIFNVIDQNDEVAELMHNFNQMEEKLHHQFKQLEFMAYRDALTGLYNRAYFEEAFSLSQKINKNQMFKAAMVVVDVDNFKQLNDHYGHDVGDKLLLELANRLTRFVKSSDKVFRFGGDEFVVILNKLQPAVADRVAMSIVNQLSAILRKPCSFNELVYNPEVSLGFYIFDDSAQRLDVYKKADIALYAAKQSGQGKIQCFIPQMEAQVQRKSYIDSGLKSALTNQEFFWVIQPQVDMYSGKTVGGEVLIRWQHQNEQIRPDLFIPVAESNQTIVPISNWLIKSVFTFMQKHVMHNITLSINMSPLHFFDGDLINFLSTMIKRFGISPYRIKLEITEGVFLERMEDTLVVINQLKSIGFQISLDDFGTGFSSLSYLKSLPIDQLKIDKSFVDGLPQNEKPVAIAKTIIDLTQNLNLKVIAEGVETQEQKEFLIANDCFECQGYYYSKPLLPNEFLVYIVPN